MSTLKPKAEIQLPPPVPIVKDPVPGPDRVIGLTDYKKWEEFKDSEDTEERKQAEEYIKTMCSQDHRKEIELYERPTDEKLVACTQFKTQGNEAYSQKSYSLAALFYRKGLLQLDYTFPDTEEQEKTFKTLEQSLHLNMAIAKYYLEEYDEVLNHCAQVLKQVPNHPKALYRKALVLYKKDNIDGSKEIVGKILQENPKNLEVKELLAEIEKKEEIYRVRQKQVYKAMLEKSD